MFLNLVFLVAIIIGVILMIKGTVEIPASGNRPAKKVYTVSGKIGFSLALLFIVLSILHSTLHWI